MYQQNILRLENFIKSQISTLEANSNFLQTKIKIEYCRKQLQVIRTKIDISDQSVIPKNFQTIEDLKLITEIYSSYYLKTNFIIYLPKQKNLLHMFILDTSKSQSEYIPQILQFNRNKIKSILQSKNEGQEKQVNEKKIGYQIQASIQNEQQQKKCQLLEQQKVLLDDSFRQKQQAELEKSSLLLKEIEQHERKINYQSQVIQALQTQVENLQNEVKAYEEISLNPQSQFYKNVLRIRESRFSRQDKVKWVYALIQSESSRYPMKCEFCYSSKMVQKMECKHLFCDECLEQIFVQQFQTYFENKRMYLNNLLNSNQDIIPDVIQQCPVCLIQLKSVQNCIEQVDDQGFQVYQIKTYINSNYLS